ncbi:Mg2+/citrate symporter [Neobacillus niacini]|nr:Mg2+/citrate symporter [Neobacillus niacini]
MLNTDSAHLFNPVLPAMIGGIVWVLFFSVLAWEKRACEARN